MSELPSYSQHMDGCMLCYKVDDYTKFIYPLKLHESLATGLPCVGAPIRTFREFTSVLDLAATVEEWSEALAATMTPAARSEARSAAGARWRVTTIGIGSCTRLRWRSVSDSAPPTCSESSRACRHSSLARDA